MRCSLATVSCAVKQEIARRFEQNLARVESMLTLYPADGGGRRDVATNDILRAGVVFLHATLEDLVRSLLEWKLPSAPAEFLENVPLVQGKARTKFTLRELAEHRGKTVDDVLRESVMEYLQDSNFNHPGELESALRTCGIEPSPLEEYRDRLGPMMKRRHWIVHRADRNVAAGSGHHTARSIGKPAVQAWLEAVRGFGRAVLDSVESEC